MPGWASIPSASPRKTAFPSARAQEAGAALVTEPGKQPWGYAGAFADPDGHVSMVRTG